MPSSFFYFLKFTTVKIKRPYRIALTFFVISIPFVFGGVAISCLLLFHKDTGKLYSADLLGAALACLGVLFVLIFLDAPNAIALNGAVAALLSTFVFKPKFKNNYLSHAPKFLSIAVFIASLSHAFLFKNENSFFKIINYKSESDKRPPLFEKWNSFSRVRVFGDIQSSESLLSG